MTMRNTITNRRTLSASVAAGLAALGLGIGAYAITNSGASRASSASANPAASGSPTSTAVVPFQKGQPGITKSVGQIPAAYKAGTGTLVTGAAADKAKAAAVASYPGGTVNRVVLMSDGQYNVHILGVNWPHHVFVSSTFAVIGAL
ncbi:MAG: hypothetical protein QOK05_1845 [Chloroflexota bacterium]|jgi:hypothetical protein|nr:hypothetical protein [Chloroflexota bacterium]